MIVIAKDRGERSNLRAAAIDALKKSNTPEVFKILVSLLKDNSRYVRITAAEALIDSKETSTIELILDVMQKDIENTNKGLSQYLFNNNMDDIDQRYEPENLVQALEIIGKLNSEKYAKTLIKALNHPNKFFRHKAVEKIAQIKSPQFVDPLILALKDEYWAVRREAVDTLVDINDVKAIEPLITYISKLLTVAENHDEQWLDNEEGIETSALFKIARIKDPRITQVLSDAAKHKLRKIRAVAILLLSKDAADEKVTDILILALKDKEESVRKLAITSLKKLNNPKATQAVKTYEELKK